jgi:RNA polymerase sigma-70 factor (ECF subfamily)
MQNQFDQLILDFQGGNAEAFKKLHEEFYSGLYYFAYRLTGKNDEADDIVAEAFWKLWKMKSGFQSYLNIKAFLYISVRNACINHLNKLKRKAGDKKELQHLFTGQEEPLYRAEVLQEEMIRAEAVEYFYNEVKKFPQQMRKIFEMRLKKNMAYVVIAGELNISQANVRNQIAAGIRRLKKKPALRKRWMLLRMLMRY